MFGFLYILPAIDGLLFTRDRAGHHLLTTDDEALAKSAERG